MRLSAVSLFLTGLASVSAGPVIRADAAALAHAAAVDDAAAKLDALSAKVTELSTSINQTVASMPSTADAEKDKIAEAVAPKMKELEAALREATEMIEAGQGKRSTPVQIQARSCSDSCLTQKAGELVAMVTGTVSGLVSTLGVGRVTVLIKPVLSAVDGLLTCLDGIVSGLLKTVSGVVASLLGGLGLGDLLGDLLGGLLGSLLGGGGGGLIGGLLGPLQTTN